MPEVKKIMRPVQVDYACDKCGEPMRSTGSILMSHPPLYPHQCPNGHKITFQVKYPVNCFEQVED